LLDSFGTLVRMDAPGPRLRTELAARGVSVSDERATDAFKAEIAYYMEHHVEGRDERSLAELRGRCARVLSDALGLEVRVDEMLAAIRFEAFPDAAPALTELRARGLRLVVASNWDCSLPRVLREAGLEELVDGVVTSAWVGAAKPDPRLFWAALEVAGAHAGRSVYVGDSPEHDVDGAMAAGLRAVLLDRDGGGEIASLAELPGVL
jgi:putative hydrolase of the HAD superfamily